jgi:hypothetical protein
MKLKQRNGLVVAITCWGMLMGPSLLAATGSPAPGPGAQDIALQAGGMLLGQVVDVQGAAMAGSPVSLRIAGQEVARVVADASGQFAVPNLRGGMYQVAAAGRIETYRFWAPQTAPPVAQPGLVFVSHGDLVRGQNCGSGVCGGVGYGAGCRGCGGGGLLGWMRDRPVLAAAAIGAAIAIPLAVSDDDPPASP